LGARVHTHTAGSAEVVVLSLEFTNVVVVGSGTDLFPLSDH